VKAGLPGPAQDIFPEEAKEEARSVGLKDLVKILRNEGEVKSGVKKDKWEVVEEDVRATIENAQFGGPRSRYLTAEQINEKSTHIIHLDPTAEVQSGDRIERDGDTWAVLAVGTRTEEATIYVEAKQI
jgi:hypothetical protein